MTEQVLRVLTYNIHKGFNTGNHRFVLHQIREALIGVNADILFLQEIQGEHRHKEKQVQDWPQISQAEFIAEDIWPHHAYGKNAIYAAGHHGNAILSKHPFESWENINVSPYSWASRSLLHGVIRLPDNRQLHVICVHLGLTGMERKQQLSSLCERIDSHVPHDAPLIIAGDFNDWLGRAERQLQDCLGLQEVFLTTHGRHARSFPAWLPVLTMDRIYFRGFAPLSCERLCQFPWRLLSDHAPLVASFSI
jgi:endonuclease/exonuclease/phosphatase family metal-dependent hydrolase